MSLAKHKIFVQKSLEAVLSAIELYNKPNFSYREESFIILMVNAWELLLKAKVLKDGKEKLNSLYIPIKNKKVDGTFSKRSTYKRNRSGNFMTIDIVGLISKIIEDKNLKVNLETLVEIRDNAIHFINSTKLFEKELLQIIAATLKNYSKLMKEWFDKSLDDVDLYLIPVAFNLPKTFTVENLTKETEAHRKLLHYMQSQREKTSNDSSFDVSLIIDVKLSRKANEGTEVKIDKNGIPIYQDSENIFRSKYPWNYERLLNNLKSRYDNFKQNKQFYNIKKELEKNKKYSDERLLDFNNPKGIKKKYYSSNILQEFDKHYNLK